MLLSVEYLLENCEIKIQSLYKSVNEESTKIQVNPTAEGLQMKLNNL